ncbi:hypothetical protein [Brevundimonas naejangsanensis]|uniref:hypothetical protein n=1 Tax=Brevundimonas naejangsanensis TaxID=588932 RepID=UPI00106CB328|nr:hypothetical protein [Brevundimonas naejangsanensis]QBQ49064.1 hypothetical protein E3U41_10450 [Brevundimonas naejangsanensis]
MPNPQEFPIIAARSYAGGVIDCLSIADAFETKDAGRADAALADALAGLEAAANQVRRAQAARRRPRFNAPAIAAALLLGLGPWVLLAGLPS